MDTQNQYKRLSPKLISAVLAVMEANRGTVPKTEREKKLAQLAPPDDTITQADVVVGRTKNFQPKQKMTPKMESKVPGVAAGSLPNDGHLCASKIMHEEWGEGTPIYSQHAEPDEAGNIEWYDIMFEHGIERAVSTDSIEILQTESHMNHKPKKRGMKEEVEQVDEIFGLSKKEKYAKKRKELAQKIVAGNPEARARRMEAMKINKTGEKAVAPELQNKYDQEDADESPKIALTAQMRHAFDKNKRSQKGYTVTFENGDKVAVPSAQAHMFLTMIAKMGRNADMRDRFQKMAAKSYKEFVKAIEQ